MHSESERNELIELIQSLRRLSTIKVEKRLRLADEKSVRVESIIYENSLELNNELYKNNKCSRAMVSNIFCKNNRKYKI